MSSLPTGKQWVRAARCRGIAALTVVLMLPGIVRADAPESEDPFQADGGSAEKDGGSPGASAPPTNVLHPDLAAQVPENWVREGGGTGKPEGPVEDPRVLNRKIRKMGRVTLAGGGIALFGAVITLTGAGLLLGFRPAKGLEKLAKDNNGYVPVDNDKRHQLISVARYVPIVVYVGAGVIAAGLATAITARLRIKKLRERRRTSALAVVPSLYGQGAEVHWQVRF